jgi:hypothetical protein
MDAGVMGEMFDMRRSQPEKQCDLFVLLAFLRLATNKSQLAGNLSYSLCQIWKFPRRPAILLASA